MKRILDVLLLLAVCVGFTIWTAHVNSQMNFLLEVVRSSKNQVTIADMASVLTGVFALSVAGLGAIAAFLAAINSALFGEVLLCRRGSLMP